jgi:hypothetical protein
VIHHWHMIEFKITTNLKIQSPSHTIDKNCNLHLRTLVFNTSSHSVPTNCEVTTKRTLSTSLPREHDTDIGSGTRPEYPEHVEDDENSIRRPMIDF